MRKSFTEVLGLTKDGFRDYFERRVSAETSGGRGAEATTSLSVEQRSKIAEMRRLFSERTSKIERENAASAEVVVPGRKVTTGLCIEESDEISPVVWGLYEKLMEIQKSHSTGDEKATTYAGAEAEAVRAAEGLLLKFAEDFLGVVNKGPEAAAGGAGASAAAPTERGGFRLSH